jgi:hypothetical protein
MKNLRSVLFVLAAILLVPAARAQQNGVKADVPFDFVVGNRAYPAGEYILTPTFNDSALIRIDSTQEVLTGYTVANPCTNGTPSKETKLVFHRMRNHYFLYRVWIEGNLAGREFPKGRAEIELARNSEKPELVIVAANVSR